MAVVPPIGQVFTPAGFVVQSAEGVVILTWNFTPLVTSYYINRSTDNITFDNIGQTSSLQYNDLSGDVDAIYYYQVQASNGTESSYATASLSGISLKPGETTLGNIKLQCLQRTDLNGSTNFTNLEMNTMVSQSYKELFDIIVQKFGDTYYLATPYVFSTDGANQSFALPNDFYKLLGVDIALSPNPPLSYWVTVKNLQFIDRNSQTFMSSYAYGGITNLKYDIQGNNIFFAPIPQGSQSIRLWYAPRPRQLINDTDIVDGVSGWEEYIVVDVACKMLVKQESDPTAFAVQKAAMLRRIESAAENRDVGEAQRTSDSKAIASWYSGNGWGNNGNGGGFWGGGM